MKKLLLFQFALSLLLPTLTAAAEKIVRVPNPCEAGKAFTIKIPVKFPDSMAVQYAWYRNDTLVEDSHMLLLGEKAISYTIPADKAYGNDVAFHFKYCLDDKCSDAWTRSPVYLVSFETWAGGDCGLNGGVVSIAACNSVSNAGIVSIAACNGVSNAGTVSITACNGVSGAGTVSIAACSGISNAGTVSIAACNGISNAGTVSITTCNGISNAGTISILR